MMMNSVNEKVTECSHVFLDFDGVIKETLEVKSRAFTLLFPDSNQQILGKIQTHHHANAGVSRFEKIPLYMSWAGIRCSEEAIAAYHLKFKETVVGQVLDAAWVAGVVDFLACNHNRKKLFIVSATPQEEIRSICEQLKISNYFAGVFGSPSSKYDIIQNVLLLEQEKTEVVMIGDSWSDYFAATRAGIGFVLRKTPYNHDICAKTELRIEDFRGLNL